MNKLNLAVKITRDLAEISRQSIQVGEGSGRVQTSVQGLSELAAQLKLLVKKHMG